MAYVVTAGRVSAETLVGPGRATIDFLRGSVLPDDVPDEQLLGFLARGEVVDEDAQPEPEPEPDEDETVDLSELDKDALLAFAEERKIAVDKRLGEDNLRAAIQAAIQEAE
jgi:hypothetical protein